MLKKIPHTFTIVFYMILFSAMLTWIIPGGEYVRETIQVNGNQREVVVDNSYHRVDRQAQTWQVFSALFEGFVDKADIIIFVLMVGGAFWILNSSRAIDTGVYAFLAFTTSLKKKRLFKFINVDYVIISLIMVMFSLFGAIFGMSEETIAFTIIFVPLAISMGYDSITGVCISYLAAHVGFAGAILNPFTIGVAQGIAELPLFSGLEYRVLCWIFLTLIAIIFVCFYARKIKKNPQSSPMYTLDEYWRKRSNQSIQTQENTKNKALWIVFIFLSVVQIYASVTHAQTILNVGNLSISAPLLPIFTCIFGIGGYFACRKSAAAFNMLLLFATIFYLVIGVLAYHWYIMEIATLFLAMGVFSGLSMAYTADKLSKLFLEGVKDILVPAMIIGLASGIIFILQEGKVIDTILYAVSSTLVGMGEVASVGSMYLFQTALNIVMPSGSAKAALTMPIMSQFSDLIQVSRQTTVLAFQFGDGFTNMITPTSGVLLGVLGVARIPYPLWVKWIWKFILAMICIGFLLLLPTLFFSWNGF
ncbi:MAG: YfcC family protein [Bacteroidales bacterium]